MEPRLKELLERNKKSGNQHDLSLSERHELSDLVDKIYDDSVVSCVYCGREYPEGTPTFKAKVLTEHVKVCEKHPMREAEQTIVLLRTALVGLVGSDDKVELEQMEAALRLMPAPDQDKADTINAIHAIIKSV